MNSHLSINVLSADIATILFSALLLSNCDLEIVTVSPIANIAPSL